MTTKHIFLIGPMGVGKTTIGKRLASLMERSFVDIDKEIENRTGADIQWIFDKEGEQGFRNRECNVLEEIVDTLDNKVIATGGGIVLRSSNRDILRKKGISIYLCASLDQLYQRTLRDKSRPLLQVENRRQVISELLEKRDPLYREVADLVFPAEGGQVSRVAQRLLDALTEL